MPKRIVLPEAEIVGMYVAGNSTYKISKEFGVDPATVRRLLKRNGQDRRCNSEAQRKLHLNHHAFTRITPDSAYWVGFLIADGCIKKRKDESNRISLGLSMVDISQVLKFKTFVGSSHKLHEDCRGSKGSAYLSFHSDHIAADLARFGVVPRKSLTARVRGGLEFNRHFWRGVVDGDGSLRRCPCGIILVGSKKLLSQFLAFVKTIYDGEVLTRVRKNGTIFRIGFYGDAARFIVKVLYMNAPTYLDRKMEAAQEIMCYRAYVSETGVRGIYPCGRGYRASIRVGGKLFHSSPRDTIREAVRDRRLLERQHQHKAGESDVKERCNR